MDIQKWNMYEKTLNEKDELVYTVLNMEVWVIT